MNTIDVIELVIDLALIVCNIAIIVIILKGRKE